MYILNFQNQLRQFLENLMRFIYLRSRLSDDHPLWIPSPIPSANLSNLWVTSALRSSHRGKRGVFLCALSFESAD